MADKDSIVLPLAIHGDIVTDTFIGRDQNNYYGYSVNDVTRLIDKLITLLRDGACLVTRPNGSIEVEHNGECLQIAPDAGQGPERRRSERAYLDFSSARRVAISVVPAGVTEYFSKCKDWRELLEAFEQLPMQSDGSNLLLSFLKTLFSHLQSNVLAEERKVEAAIFIELRPSINYQFDNEAFHIRICSWDSNLPSEKQYRVEIESIEGRINSFVEIIFQHIQSFAELVGTEDNLHIEFFLPYDRLNEPIEEWQINNPVPMQLGAEYIVMTRSLSLIKEDARRKWQRVKSCYSIPAKESFVICNLDQSCSDRLHEELKDSGYHGVVFERLPDEKLKVLAHLVKSRLPIALWARENEIPTFILDEWMNHPLSELPMLVKNLRRDAHRNRLQNPSIVLFWNNPEQLPPSFTRVFGSP